MLPPAWPSEDSRAACDPARTWRPRCQSARPPFHALASPPGSPEAQLRSHGVWKAAAGRPGTQLASCGLWAGSPRSGAASAGPRAPGLSFPGERPSTFCVPGPGLGARAKGEENRRWPHRAPVPPQGKHSPATCSRLLPTSPRARGCSRGRTPSPLLCPRTEYRPLFQHHLADGAGTERPGN